MQSPPPARSIRSWLLAALMAAVVGCHASQPATVVATPVAPASSIANAGTADPARDTVRRGYAASDVRFAHHMLMHHAQALVMTAMVPSRSARADVRLVAERITISQGDEIALMQRWLRARGEAVPATAAAGMDHAQHGGMGGMPMGGAMGGTMGDSAHATMMASMPGMLTSAELAQLEASTGAAFDTLFVRFMIRHHEGALAMVRDYLATPGAAQEPEIFRFASDIDADQRAEIRRLRGLVSQ